MYVKLGMDMEEEDTAAALLKLLEGKFRHGLRGIKWIRWALIGNHTIPADTEEPRRFCLHKAVQGSEHQCTPQQTSSMPQINTVLVDGTPIQLKKVLGLHMHLFFTDCTPQTPPVPGN